VTHTERLLGPRRDEFLAVVRESSSIGEVMRRLGTTNRAVTRAARELKVLLPHGNILALATQVALDRLTEQEAADYKTFKLAGYSHEEALDMTGRADLKALVTNRALP
jgi:hypothetical protein